MQAVTPAERDSNWQAIVIAKNQKEYDPIPANWHYPFTETKWKLSVWERIKLLFTGHIHIVFMTFGDPFSPMMIDIEPIQLGPVKDGWNVPPVETTKTGSNRSFIGTKK